MPNRHAPAPTLLLCLLLTAASAGGTPARAAELSLARIFDSPDLSGPTLRAVELAPDGSRVTYLRGSDAEPDRLDLWAYDPASDTASVLVAADDLLPEPVELSDEEKARRERARIADLSGILEYRFSTDGRAILFPLGGDIFFADLTREPVEVRQITSGDSFDLDPRLSPDGRSVAFVRDGNLWLADLDSGDARALTANGGGTVTNGLAEFIAQEEMDRDRGFWWSPDGERIAFLQVDDSTIEPSRRYEVAGDEITMIEQRYPYAGTPNARLSLGVITIETGDIRWLSLGSEPDIYVPRVTWHPSGDAVVIQRQSRDQKTLDLLIHPLRADAPRRILRETSETWINLHHDLRFLEDGERFLWSSERSGFRHLYLVETGSGEARALTAGDWPVAELVAVDEDLGLVYFTAGVETPTERHLYRQSLITETPEAVTRISRRAGWHSIAFDSSGRRYLDLFSSTEQPPQLSLHSADGDRLAWLVENRIDDDHPYAPFQPGHRPTEFGTIDAVDGQALHYRIVRPSDFDAARRYPVFLHVYGGPTGRTVENRWGRRHLVDQYMARAGYVVFSLDNRGIEGQGTAFQAPAYRMLGQVEVVDQLTGVAYLESLPWIDSDRIGVFGWSYGGYMTLMMLMQHPGTFAAGAAVAPVTDWALYDTHYTERYLGMPRDEDGRPTEAYRLGNVLTHADELSDPLLLIHGMADDNVLFTHSTLLMQRLQSRAIDFELMTYPGEKHSIAGEGQRLHVFRQIDRFFEREVRGSGD